MEINADFTKRAVVHGAKQSWQPSPMAGVDRRMLDRIGAEVARATSIVRYAPGSHFSAHTHTGGEEFLVLEGVFQDEHGDFAAGTYVRNPPTSSHTPGSKPGCTIFVKLWQFDMNDRTQLRIDTESEPYLLVDGKVGVERLELFINEHEQVSMEKWHPNTPVELNAELGMEVLVTKGGFTESDEEYESQSWLRLPKGGATVATAGEDGATVLIKRNHLGDAPKPPIV